MLSKLRTRASSFFSDIVRVLKIKPVYYTFMGLLFSFLYLFAIYQGNILLAVLFILLSGFMDVLDGLAARLIYLPSKFGAFLDSVFDRIEDGIYIVGLLFINNTTHNNIAVMIMLLETLLISYISARARSLKLNTGNETTIMERSDRIILLTIILIAYTVWGVEAYLFLTLLYIVLALYNIVNNIFSYSIH